MNNPIVWIDCEMTGLDTAVDELVEVAVVVTDSDLRPADEGIDVLIRPSQAAVAHMNEFVRTMHTNSGLIEEWENGLDLQEAAARVLAYIVRNLGRRRWAGTRSARTRPSWNGICRRSSGTSTTGSSTSPP